MRVHLEEVRENNTEHTNIGGDNKQFDHSDFRLTYKIHSSSTSRAYLKHAFKLTISMIWKCLLMITPVTIRSSIHLHFSRTVDRGLLEKC